MSLDMAAAQSSERVCYVQCNFCNTILAVSVPCSSLYTNVTVRCGHCANLLSVNMAGTSLQTGPQDFQGSQKQIMGADPYNNASSSSCASFGSIEQEQPRLPPIRHCHVYAAPEKRQRVPSAYNKFIKEEIQRIKADNPEISHREAFSTAAKNWAHFPHINWLKMDGNKRAKSDQSFTDGSGQKSNGFY